MAFNAFGKLKQKPAAVAPHGYGDLLSPLDFFSQAGYDIQKAMENGP